MNPFAQTQLDRVDRFGEEQLVHFIKEWLADASPESPQGIGDDTAVLQVPCGRSLLLTTDSLTYTVHFDDTASPAQAGAKLLKRNLSDIAAMGGSPLHSVVAITCGADLSVQWLEGFFHGLRDAAILTKCEINGGDLSQGAEGTFTATLSLVGQAEKPIYRKGGSAESWVWVTGSLGGSILGHHLSFQPRLKEGQWLGKNEAVTAMMDVTDGLASDLPKMLPEGLRAKLDLSCIPTSDEARAAAQDTGKPAVWHAFTDGEDYELLFFTKPGIDHVAFEEAWKEDFKIPLAAIGTLEEATSQKGSSSNLIVDLDGRPVFSEGGFTHFE
ncbi:MAG: thiamine-phosphate kinase [Verrucomicrobiota bacterium]